MALHVRHISVLVMFAGLCKTATSQEQIRSLVEDVNTGR